MLAGSWIALALSLLLTPAGHDVRQNTVLLMAELSKIVLRETDLPSFEKSPSIRSYLTDPNHPSVYWRSRFVKRSKAIPLCSIDLTCFLAATPEQAAVDLEHYCRMITATQWVEGLPDHRLLLWAEQCRYLERRMQITERANLSASYAVSFRSERLGSIIELSKSDPALPADEAAITDEDKVLVENVARKLIASYQHKPFTIPGAVKDPNADLTAGEMRSTLFKIAIKSGDLAATGWQLGQEDPRIEFAPLSQISSGMCSRQSCFRKWPDGTRMGINLWVCLWSSAKVAADRFTIMWGMSLKQPGTNSGVTINAEQVRHRVRFGNDGPASYEIAFQSQHLCGIVTLHDKFRGERIPTPVALTPEEMLLVEDLAQKLVANYQDKPFSMSGEKKVETKQ